jgi:hypothetical protein
MSATTSNSVDRMLSAVLAAGGCLNIPAAPFTARWRVPSEDGVDLHFSETTSNRPLIAGTDRPPPGRETGQRRADGAVRSSAKGIAPGGSNGKSDRSTEASTVTR